MLNLKYVIMLFSFIVTVATSAYYVSGVLGTLDTRISVLNENIKTILIQVEALTEVNDTKLNSRIDLVELEVKQCRCISK